MFLNSTYVTLPGTYTPGRASPGSDADCALRARAGYPGVVFRLRYHGIYLPVPLIKRRPVPQGLVVSQEMDSNQWHMTFTAITGHPSPLLPVLRTHSYASAATMAWCLWMAESGMTGIWTDGHRRGSSRRPWTSAS